jgi:hypothetical protein
MAVLGKDLEYGSPSKLQLWLAESDHLQTASVFLVRARLGTPAFARICTEADLINYPDSPDDAPGWYRVAGVEFEAYSSETLGKIITECQQGLALLDQEVEASASADAAVELNLPLHLYRTGSLIGNLVVSKQDAGDSFALTFHVEFSDPTVQAAVSADVFRVSSGTFQELLGIRTPDQLDYSASASADPSYEFTASITVYLNKDKPELENELYGALASDIEDLCSFIVTGA